MINELLPSVNSYSKSDIDAATSVLPVLTHYLQLLERDTTDKFEILRQRRLRAFVECSLANYFKKVSAAVVCQYWSETADNIIREVFCLSGLSQQPVAIFAVGKLGAHELNLSSDIDIMFVSDDNAIVDKKIFSDFVNTLSKRTEFGFLYRVDLDLRPGGRLGPTIGTVSQFEDYYGNYGETWERLALIRLRPITGKPEIIKKVDAFSQRFCFRKHLDFTLLEDLKTLREKIQHQYPARNDQTFNLKLGVGGIRDIELFVHALQVIHGGKVSNLKTKSTEEAVRVLSEQNLLQQDDANFLINSYWQYRQLENLVQSKDDQQTHIWINSDWSQFYDWNTLVGTAQQVDKIVSTLLGAPRKKDQIPVSTVEQLKWLGSLGFNSEKIKDDWNNLFEAKVLSKKSDRDEEARRIFLQDFMIELSKTDGDKDLALALLVDFVRAIRAKATFFTLFNRQPNLIRELSWLLSTSPYLAQILISRPELIDSYFLKTSERFSEDLNVMLEQLGDFRLLSDLINSSQFLAQQDIFKLTASLSETADTVCKMILRATLQEFPASSLSFLTMGKWAGREMGLRSDIDFVFVTANTVTQEDHKVARRIITRLTQKNRGGFLYSLDLRLRPSGNAGPVIVSLEQLEDYLKSEAKIWERQAYLKARPLAGGDIPVSAWAQGRDLEPEEVQELISIKAKLLKPKGKGIDLKFTPGGLVDIEFTCQWEILKSKVKISSASTTGFISDLANWSSSWRSHAQKLKENYLFLRILEQLHQLVTNIPGSCVDFQNPAIKVVARLLRKSPEDLESDVLSIFSDNRQILDALNPFRG